MRKTWKVHWLFAVGLTFVSGKSVLAHDYIAPALAPAGYNQDLEIRVAHGCEGSPTTEVRVKIPEEIYDVKIFHNRDWEIETKMRVLDPPITDEFGRKKTEAIDEIIWKNPSSPLPDMRVEGFRIRPTLPNEPGRILFFRTINNCAEGSDSYIELPEEDISIDDEDFAEKFMSFISMTGPSPYIILYDPGLPQYPWQWNTQDIRDAIIRKGN